MAAENYLGNPNLKSAGVKVEWEPGDIEQYLKCSKNPTYFIRNYVKIISVDEGLIPFNMYDYQSKMVDTFQNNRFVIAKMARQTGKSTTIISYLLWYALFHENTNIAVLANKGAIAREILGRLQLAYENLPLWLQQGVLVWNKGNIELENGSKILASATSSSAIRGLSLNVIFLDEFAHVPPGIAEQFFTSVYPTISSGESTKVLIVSTPLGMNMFYKMWIDAEESRSKYIPIEVHWSEVPGRDEVWKKETIANTSEDQFNQEFECQFIGSVNTLISPSKLRTLAFLPPIRSDVGIDVYEEPDKQKTYVMVADVAKGTGLDYSAFSIVDITQVPYKQVAVYRSNKITPMVFPTMINSVAKSYNDAFVLIELNGIGEQCANILYYDMEYENIIMSSFRGRAGQQVGSGFSKNAELGVSTTKQVKRIGCSTLKEMIENDKLIITDFNTISELTTFVSRGQSYEAEEGLHDDLVMTLVLFSWLVQQQYFKELTEQDIRERMYSEKIKQLEENMVPFGVINDGQSQERYVQIPGDNSNWVADDPKYFDDHQDSGMRRHF